MADTMCGLVKEAAGPGMFVFHEDLPIPEPGDDEVLVKVHTAALCGTDLHIIEWDPWTKNWAKKVPFVPGHEVGGEIVAVGKNVTERKPGDRVSCESHVACGTCYPCTHGLPNVCQNMELLGVGMNGAFAEYFTVRWDVTYVLDDAIDYDTACLFEPMGAGVHGVEKAEVSGKNVLISGAGPIGLTAVAAAKTFGAKQVICCDLIDDKLAIAKKMGADTTVNSGEEDLREIVMDHTDGIGVDAAIDVTSAGPAIQLDIKLLRAGGRFVGVGLPTKPVEMDLANDVFYREIEVTGISGRLIWRTWDDFSKVMKGPYFKVEEVTGKRFRMRDIDKAVQAVKDGVPGKMFLYPDSMFPVDA
ncbi:MAG: alcohol dehydrogenase catalytic domain-containing protein [Eubacteriales bacterium]|nr:alcohol dehydrogenase catalytic domain-containing protein [Eubacteriales bacterium]